MKKNDVVSVSFREYLKEELENRKKRRPSYSLRAFAKSLAVDHSDLSKLLKGKRSLGTMVIRDLGVRLNLSSEQIQKFIDSHKVRRKLKTGKTDRIHAEYKTLTAQETYKVSNWYDYVILELMDVKGFQADEKWIARVMGLPIATVRSSLKNLFEVGMIIEVKGQWEKPHVKTTTNPADPEAAEVRLRLLKQIFEKATQAVGKGSKETQLHGATTFAIDPALLPLAAEKVRAFRLEMDELLNRTPNRTQVYELAIALYPVSDI